MTNNALIEIAKSGLTAKQSEAAKASEQYQSLVVYTGRRGGKTHLACRLMIAAAAMQQFGAKFVI